MSGARVPGEGPGNGEGTIEVLAGEYVLGLLDEDLARTVEERARREPELAAAIASWQARFDPLADIPPPLAPSETLWPRISAGLNRAPAAHVVPPVTRRPPDIPAPVPAVAYGPWRGIALASLAVAACLAAFIILSKPAAEPARWKLATALLSVPGSAAASLKAQVTGFGTMTVVPLQHIDVPADHRLGFWAWPATERAPVLLGLIAPQGGQVRFPYAAKEGTPVMVTLEPGAAPPGSKPGPTLYLGLLVANPA
jgi:anti-sigma-K factor RskA